MTSRTLLASLACLLLHSSIIGQESIHILEQDYFSIQADDNYHENLFGVALSEFETLPIDDVIDLTARSSFELDETRSIDLLLESVIRSEDADRSYELFRDIGNKYFDRKEYRKAKGYYARINDETLFNSRDQATIFRKGYVHLVDKDFKRSETYFDAASELKGDLTPHAQYYAGITKYHQGKVDESIQYFRKVENHKRYRDLIPYYFAQLFFKNEEYDEAITYGKKALSNPKGDQSRINRMVGLSYLAKGNKREALPYLEAYATNSKKLTENEFYQLGYLTYELDQYEKSANYLKEIAHRNSDIGQMSNYLLGSISVKTGDKKKDGRCVQGPRTYSPQYG